MPKITLIQSGKISTIETDEGPSLLNIIQSNGFDIIAPCGGNGTCGKCRVQIKGGDFVSACIFYPKEDLEVLLPDLSESQVLKTQYEYSEKVLLDPGDCIKKASKPYGVAIDIGTTTLVFYLIDLISGSILTSNGIPNPQAKYGADVISRIHYCSKKNGLRQLHNEIIGAIDQELSALLKSGSFEKDSIVKIAVAGNNTMLHILLGIDPSSLAQAPFTPVFTGEKKLSNAKFGLLANKSAEIDILPSISAFVGADIVSGLASLAPPNTIKNYLFIDIGTNGEIALVTPEQTWCCATAAGPAFEGAAISCGMAAFEGALASYRNPDSFTTIANQKAAGICGSGLIDIVSYLLKQKLLTTDGSLENDFIVCETEGTKQYLSINQQDIREIQLAKAAIMAGINILVQSAGMNYDQIDALFLAGGFGNYISIQSAIEIALLPSELKDKIVAIGNSSGSGACLAVKSRLIIKKIAHVAKSARYIELSSREDFALEYAMKMSFPEYPSVL